MSQASNLSTRANMSSPWDPLSAASSRRSSMVEHGTNGQHHGMTSGHIERLQRKAQIGPQPAHHARQSSALSDCGSDVPPPSYGASASAPRRASDPVRTMDRNFGVNAPLSKHRSYSQLNHTQRPPVHGQDIRGQEYQGQYQSQQQFNYQGQGYQGQPWSQQEQYGYNAPYNYQQGYNNYPQGPEGQWNQHWQGQSNWGQNQGQNWSNNQRSQQQSNNYQRTLEYVQQCQTWSGDQGSNPGPPAQ